MMTDDAHVPTHLSQCVPSHLEHEVLAVSAFTHHGLAGLDGRGLSHLVRPRREGERGGRADMTFRTKQKRKKSRM